jgi:long-chain acyl-CoA synthetase
MDCVETRILTGAKHHPSRPAIVFDRERLTYAQLREAVERRAEQLGPLNGRPVVFRATPCAGTIVCYLAVHLAGGVCVPLDKDAPDCAVQRANALLAAATIPPGVADVLFTTGTTGTPKGVMVGHGALLANSENLIGAQGYAPGLTFAVNGPLNHIGSLSKIAPTLMAGGTVRVTNGMKHITDFLRSIGDAPHKAATFLVPASIRMLTAFAADSLATLKDKIDFLETGAAPMAQSDMERLGALLPHSRLYNTYASTETGVIATFDFNAGECLAGCVGHAMRHSAFHVSAEGMVVCAGRTLMTGYLGDKSATERVLRGGELHTADCGTVDDKGRLLLQGRKDDVINAGGYKVSPVEVENAALAVPFVKDCACVPFAHPVTGTALRLLVVADKAQYDRRQLVSALRERLEPHKLPQDIRLTQRIERTFNGKIDRKRYLG